MKLKIVVFLACSVGCFTGRLGGQSNFITNNPDFITNVEGWSASGGAILTHAIKGAKTPGAALLQVRQPGSQASSIFQSSSISIPAGMAGQMLYLSFFAHSDQEGTISRIRVDLAGIGGVGSQQLSDELHLEESFQEYAMPVYIPQGTKEVRIRLLCGSQAGNYFFDDFRLVQSPVDTSGIRQFDNWEPRVFKMPAQVLSRSLSEGPADVQVQLFPREVIAPVLPTQFGVNSNIRSGNSLLDRTGLYDIFGAFRFPAGSGSNQYFWDGEVPASFAIPVEVLSGSEARFLSPENFVTFKRNAKGEGTVVVNYFYARYGLTAEGTRESKVQQAADYAAGLVRFFNVEHRAGIKYWEIGNECYGAWETGYDVNGSIVTGKEYGEDFRVFAEAMKAVDPDIQLGAVLSHRLFEWNNQVLREVEDHADFLIVHHYFEVEDAFSAAIAIQGIRNDMQEIQAAAGHHTSKVPGHFPVAFTEFNIQGDQATTITNGLFTADVLGTVIENRFSMSNIWVNEWGISGNHSKGLLALNDPDQPNYTARPTYTPFHFYNRYFGDRMIRTKLTGSDQLKTYASTFSDGKIGVVLINYSGEDQTLAFDLADSTLVFDSIYWHSVYAENRQAGNKKFYVNGQTGATPGGGPVDLSVVPAFAAAYHQHNHFLVPKFSATYLVLTTGTITSTGSVNKRLPERLYPNPTSGWLVFESQGGAPAGFFLYDLSGREVGNYLSIAENSLQRVIFNCSRLPSGIYLLKSQGGTHKFVKK